MAANFGQGPVFPSVLVLPAAVSNTFRMLVQGGKLWFSDGSTWIDLGAVGGGGSAMPAVMARISLGF